MTLINKTISAASINSSNVNPFNGTELGNLSDAGLTEDLPGFTTTLGTIMLVVGTIGIFGNCTSVLIFSRKRMKSPVAILLLGLSVADLFLIILCLLAYAVPLLIQDHEAQRRYLVVTAVTTYPVTHIVQTLSLWLLVMITIERYIAVAHPFLASRLMSCAKTRSWLVALCLASFAYNLCRFFEWKLVYTQLPQGDTEKIHGLNRSANLDLTTNSTRFNDNAEVALNRQHSIFNTTGEIARLMLSSLQNSNFINASYKNGDMLNESYVDQVGTLSISTVTNDATAAAPEYGIAAQPHLRSSTIYFQVYSTGLYLATQFALPLLVLLILNFKIVYIVRAAQRQRKFLSSSQKTEHRLAIMMVVVVLIFLVCRTTPSIINIAEAIKKDLFDDPSTVDTAYLIMDISNCLVILNLSINWLVYLCFNRRYRMLFLWHCCRVRGSSGAGDCVTYSYNPVTTGTHSRHHTLPKYSLDARTLLDHSGNPRVPPGNHHWRKATALGIPNERRASTFNNGQNEHNGMATRILRHNLQNEGYDAQNIHSAGISRSCLNSPSLEARRTSSLADRTRSPSVTFDLRVRTSRDETVAGRDASKKTEKRIHRRKPQKREHLKLSFLSKSSAKPAIFIQSPTSPHLVEYNMSNGAVANGTTQAVGTCYAREMQLKASVEKLLSNDNDQTRNSLSQPANLTIFQPDEQNTSNTTAMCSRTSDVINELNKKDKHLVKNKRAIVRNAVTEQIISQKLLSDSYSSLNENQSSLIELQSYGCERGRSGPIPLVSPEHTSTAQLLSPVKLSPQPSPYNISVDLLSKINQNPAEESIKNFDEISPPTQRKEGKFDSTNLARSRRKLAFLQKLGSPWLHAKDFLTRTKFMTISNGSAPRRTDYDCVRSGDENVSVEITSLHDRKSSYMILLGDGNGASAPLATSESLCSV